MEAASPSTLYIVENETGATIFDHVDLAKRSERHRKLNFTSINAFGSTSIPNDALSLEQV